MAIGTTLNLVTHYAIGHDVEGHSAVVWPFKNQRSRFGQGETGSRQGESGCPAIIPICPQSGVVHLRARRAYSLLLSSDQQLRDAVLCSPNIEGHGPIKVERSHSMQDSPQILEQEFGPRIRTTCSGQPFPHYGSSSLKAALRDRRDSIVVDGHTVHSIHQPVNLLIL